MCCHFMRNKEIKQSDNRLYNQPLKTEHRSEAPRRGWEKTVKGDNREGKRAHWTMVKDYGCCGGRRHTVTTPEGRNPKLPTKM